MPTLTTWPVWSPLRTDYASVSRIRAPASSSVSYLLLDHAFGLGYCRVERILDHEWPRVRQRLRRLMRAP